MEKEERKDQITQDMSKPKQCMFLICHHVEKPHCYDDHDDHAMNTNMIVIFTMLLLMFDVHRYV